MMSPMDNPNFAQWFRGSKVVDEDGEPLRVYHGTTHEFSRFSKKNGNIENDWGKAFYFTNEPEDVGQNYAGIGPDLSQRIEISADRIEANRDVERDRAKKMAMKKNNGLKSPTKKY